MEFAKKAQNMGFVKHHGYALDVGNGHLAYDWFEHLHEMEARHRKPYKKNYLGNRLSSERQTWFCEFHLAGRWEKDMTLSRSELKIRNLRTPLERDAYKQCIRCNDRMHDGCRKCIGSLKFRKQLIKKYPYLGNNPYAV